MGRRRRCEGEGVRGGERQSGGARRLVAGADTMCVWVWSAARGLLARREVVERVRIVAHDVERSARAL